MEEKTPDVPAADRPPLKRSRRALLIAPILFLAGAGGGFWGWQKGIMPLLSNEKNHDKATDYDLGKDIAFIPLEPILINLGAGESGRFLRFQAQIEVAASAEAEVNMLIPRLMDVLNGYLRAVDPALLEERTALIRLKAQMLRRLQMVAGGSKVRDLLVMEFVVS